MITYFKYIITCLRNKNRVPKRDAVFVLYEILLILFVRWDEIQIMPAYWVIRCIIASKNAADALQSLWQVSYPYTPIEPPPYPFLVCVRLPAVSEQW